MLYPYTVCFFGHRYIDNHSEISEEIYRIVKQLIKEKEYVEFLVGRDGDFDLIVVSAIRRAIKESDYGNSSLIWVLPYDKAEFKNNRQAYENYYDSIEICEGSAKAHPKAAISIRNRYMIDRSDVCVFYVSKSNGGAYQALRYAEKQDKKIINLSNNKFV